MPSSARPLVSILIPCYNAENSIEAAVSSALDQTYPQIEVVVVDDGSTDGSLQILSRLQSDSRVMVRRQKNQGECAARNSCMESAQGEYLICLDADDRLTPDAVESLYFKVSHDGAEMAAGLSTQVYENRVEHNPPSYFCYPQDAMASLVRNWWPVSAVLFKRTETRWNVDLKSWGVIEFFLDLFLLGWRCSLLDKPVTLIDMRVNPARSSVVFDHYSPRPSLQFFAAMKAKARQEDLLNFTRNEAFDKHILHFAYRLVAQDPKSNLNPAVENVELDLLRQYDWYNPIGVSGFCRWLGIRRGLRCFHRLNRLIGREK